MKPAPVPAVDCLTSVAEPRGVVIVDDHAPTLAAVTALLEREYPRIEVVGTASDGKMALRVIRGAAPDVVVLDLDLGDESGLDLLPAIRGYPYVAVIVLTASDDPLVRSQALAAGAVAFVSKLSPAEDLITAVLTARAQSSDTGGLSRQAETF